MTSLDGAALTRVGHRVTTDDGRSFDCPTGDTLLRAALRAGVAATYECNSGGCGTCKYTLSSGSVHQLDPDAPGLTPRDKRKGKMLGCQSIPLTDCEVSLVAGEAWYDGHTPPRHLRAQVTDVASLTHDLREVTLRTDGPADFLPGQFAMLSADAVPVHHGSPGDAPRRLERAYSMSNLPNPQGVWQFQIKRVPNGAVSPIFVDRLAPGDTVTIDGPYGHAHLRSTERDVVVVAGGSGLAPMVSVARGLAARPDAARRRLDFFYGGRGAQDMCAGAFVEEVSAALHSATLVEAVSTPADAADDGWTGPRGYIHELIGFDSLPDLADREIYVAGPPPMTDAVVRMLVLDLGISTDNIHYDKFF
ncbi:2Fe-2S iron-sulfur cluster binding domain-containing protein [Gordonia sp. TBRC 11910]|uniref:2Fe-2S iron-sulfur cluster binding domain-containing protein n=1 Tax=Gordonia asplenii TaxID=2725283 RepID=A0A848L6F0_9ACTN|nr:2Fe-2S iron-sulfur cluster-binding protein [Gordonia asplenii]NMO04111.1 2Fe-2S iron-sulfur cluster binding domain-containing protein [Gordonia asplenii]